MDRRRCGPWCLGSSHTCAATLPSCLRAQMSRWLPSPHTDPADAGPVPPSVSAVASHCVCSGGHKTGTNHARCGPGHEQSPASSVNTYTVQPSRPPSGTKTQQHAQHEPSTRASLSLGKLKFRPAFPGDWVAKVTKGGMCCQALQSPTQSCRVAL